jgi:hypothetical protein
LDGVGKFVVFGYDIVMKTYAHKNTRKLFLLIDEYAVKALNHNLQRPGGFNNDKADSSRTLDSERLFYINDTQTIISETAASDIEETCL